jgi:serine/threonine protein kinase
VLDFGLVKAEGETEEASHHVTEGQLTGTPAFITEIEIPDALDRIVLKCLAKDPEDRFQSVRGLQDALAEVPTTGAWDRRRAERWWNGHRPASLALAG